MRLHLAPSIAPALCALAVACGEKPAATPADAATTDVAADAPAGADATPDVGAQADSGSDTAVDVGPAGPDPKSAYGKRCSAIAEKMCQGMLGCCGKNSDIGGDCVGSLTKGCLAWDGATAAAAGELALDPAFDATCTSALAKANQVCSIKALDMASKLCSDGWYDPAGINQPCHVATDVACAGGKGRCVEVLPPDDWKCLAAFTEGEACNKIQPCQLQHTCLDTDLPRAKQCRLDGSKCGSTGATKGCNPGFLCNNSECIADPGAPSGAACQKDADCRNLSHCTAGKCLPDMCELLPPKKP